MRARSTAPSSPGSTRNGAKADFCFLADRGIVGNGHMLMLEDNSDEIAGIILDWLDEPRQPAHESRS